VERSEGGSAGSAASPTGGTGATANCDGIEEDLLTSPLHCGACGNDCRLGACNLGRCSPAPTLLVPYGDPPSGPRGVSFVLDETRIYFADGYGGRIASASKDGTDQRDILTGLAWPSSIAVDGDFVYFATEDPTVERVSKLDGTSTLISTEPNPSNLVVTGAISIGRPASASFAPKQTSA